MASKEVCYMNLKSATQKCSKQVVILYKVTKKRKILLHAM